MTIGFATRSRLTVLVLGAAALGTTGCELIPGLLSGGGGSPPSDPAFTSAPLTVTVERVEGTIEGTPLERDVVDASGFRSGLALQFDVELLTGDAFITVSTSGSESSSQNPYFEGRGDFGEGFPADAGLPPDLSEPGAPSFDPSAATIMVCSLETCRQADDFGLEIAQLAEGRDVVVDGTWSGGDRIHLEMHYEEQR